MENLPITVRTLAVLKALNVQDLEQLYLLDIPSPGTIVKPGIFPFYKPLIMTTRVYNEIQELQTKTLRIAM